VEISGRASVNSTLYVGKTKNGLPRAVHLPIVVVAALAAMKPDTDVSEEARKADLLPTPTWLSRGYEEGTTQEIRAKPLKSLP
jgi:hypothetical protein